MKSRITTPAPAIRILNDLLCKPVAMRGDHHSAFIIDLIGRRSDEIKNFAEVSRARELRTNTGPAADGNGAPAEPALYPWEEPSYTVENGIAIVDVCGPLVKGYDDCTCWYYGLCSTDDLQATLLELAARGDIAAVVFRFNTPGGDAAGIAETAAMITDLSAKGILAIAAITDQACSGGYWLASACDEVVTTISACSGCIGTYIALYDYTEMLTKYGIKLELFKRGTFKAIGVEGAPLTDEQRAFLDESVGRTNDRFLAAVRAGRGTVADSTMQGQWFDGDQAVALNLADRLVPSLESVLSELRSTLSQAMSEALSP